MTDNNQGIAVPQDRRARCIADQLVALRKRLKKLIPYWLVSHHEERCAGCDHPHARAVSARCSGCDRNYCPVCVEVVDGESFCSECHDTTGGGP